MNRDQEPNRTFRAVVCNFSFQFIFLALIAGSLVSCRTPPPLPAVDLSSPGWIVRQGQAVWKPSKDRPELSGDLLLATNSTGALFVQFSKTPFPVATAQAQPGQWQIEFGNASQRYGGRGRALSRFSWFELPRVLDGAKPDGGWKFKPASTNAWHLYNFRTGESLEGYLNP